MAKLTSKCKWACVMEPNTKFTPEWSITAILTPNQEKKLKAAGYNVKTDKDGDTILKIKRNVNKRDGSVADAPDVVDALGNPWPKGKLIGNGSTVEIHFSTFEAFGKPATYLNQVVVVDHVAYGDDLSFDDDDDVAADKDDFDPE